MSTLCDRNEKVRKETEKHDFYDFGIIPTIVCDECNKNNSEVCLMSQHGFFIMPEEAYKK